MSKLKLTRRVRMLAIISVAMLVGVASSIIYFKTQPQAEQPEGAQSEVENVDLSYLVEYFWEFENEKIRVTGSVNYPVPIGVPEFPKFWLDGVEVRAPMGVVLPSENSVVTVVGTIIRIGENAYAISADSWTEDVDLSYLAEHIAEFENKEVRVTGAVGYPEIVAEPPRAFWLDGVRVIISEHEACPLENSIVTVVGRVSKPGPNSYAIHADNWSYT